MFRTIKNFLKTLFIVLILVLLAAVIYKYYELKKEGKLDEFLAGNKQEIVYINATDPYKSNHSEKEDSVKENVKENNSNSNEDKFVLEKKNYEGYYNEFNFDNVLLMYEGNQTAEKTKIAIDRLIKNADDSLYTKPTVVFQNFNNLSRNEITAENIELYKNILQEANSSIKNGMYNFRFEYSKFNAIVDTIIITKE